MSSMPHRKPIIGLTGGIGSGKSEVAEILAGMGCVVARSDTDGRAALRDPTIKATLVRWWGEEILDEAQEIDRSAVAAIVFSDPEQRRRLEALTHPWIEARRAVLFASASAETPALVIDAPLLVEAGLDAECDAIIFVEASRSVRLARVRKTRGWGDSELDRREVSQLPLDVKRARADHVVGNENDLSDLTAQIRTILSKVVESRHTRHK